MMTFLWPFSSKGRKARDTKDGPRTFAWKVFMKPAGSKVKAVSWCSDYNTSVLSIP